ncbi:ATP-dependent DNA helicase PIF1 [Linum perenne]
MASIASDSGKLFFLYGHGGSGKTYLYNCVVAKVRSEGQIALVVASSGIAATLLPGGVTAHSRFKIPINIDHSSTCVIKKGTSLAHLIQQATLIVWDEAPMVNRKPFGGKIVILGGDFRQTLPVITHGRREDSLGASLTRSYLWNHCILLRLHSNMRINDSSINTSQSFDDLSFPDWVLAIGDGRIIKNKPKDCTTSDWIEIPPYFMVPPSPNPVAAIVACVYSNLQASYQNVAYIRSRAIITPINKVVTTINDYVLGKLAGTTKIYLSADTLTTTGIVMLLRNLNSLVGLCNGTRILLTHLATNVVRGLIIGGTFERKQFPLRLCYAMTINKSQGQTLDKVGLYLPTPVFSHGQLYVAVSRVRSADGLHIYIENPNNLPINVTRNIVFDEVFEDLHIHCETNVTIPN